MKSKTILGADGATKMRQITVGIHGKGGEAGIKAIQQLAGIISEQEQARTMQRREKPQEREYLPLWK